MKAGDLPISLFCAALDKLEHQLVDKSVPVDDVAPNGLKLELFYDGSNSIIIDWISTAPDRSKERKVLDAVFGAGETQVNFDTLDDLKKFFEEKRVWQD